MIRPLNKLVGLLFSAVTIVTFTSFEIAEAVPIEDIRSIAASITVRIDRAGSEGNQGSGVIVNRQGNTYTVLTNWHVVKERGEYIIQSSDEIRHTVRYDNIQRVGNMDLAELKFTSNKVYKFAQRGNSNDVTQNEAIYVPGWINPSPSIRERAFYTAQGQVVTRSRSEDNEEGYSLGYSLNIVQIGMSGGPILNKEGLLIGINGLGIRDLNTGTVGLVAGIPINAYAQMKALAIPSARSPSNRSTQTTVPLAPHLRLQIQIQDISAELTHLQSKISILEDLLRRTRIYSNEKAENINKIKENLPTAYQQCNEIDKQIETFRQFAYQNESKVTSESFVTLVNTISSFKDKAASLRGKLDSLSIEVTQPSTRSL
jgi:Trypsin-like peptidase domain